MDKSKRPTYLNANQVAAQIAAPGNFNDDPFSIELERRDQLPGDNATATDDKSSRAAAFMAAVLEEKEALLKEAEFVRKLMRLDELTVGKDDDEEEVPKKKIVKAKKKAVPLKLNKPRRKMIISDDEDEDDDDMVGGGGGAKKTTATAAGDDDDGKDLELDAEKAAEDEDTDEEKPLDEEEDFEEVRAVFEFHFPHFLKSFTFSRTTTT